MLYKIEPPYTERYVRWCERTINKIIIYLLLDFSSYMYVTNALQMLQSKFEQFLNNVILKF